MDDVATLLDQGIEVGVVNKLIKNNANLRDIVINSQMILNRGIRVDLVNEWLDNETHLNSAIVIINRGVDLNLIGTSSKVGDFIGLIGATPNEIVSRVPKNATIRSWQPSLNIKDGMKFEWTDASGQDWLVEMHGPDSNPKLPAMSNAARGWVVRIMRNKYYMDNVGNFHKQNWLNPKSSKYDPINANAAHIPIQSP